MIASNVAGESLEHQNNALFNRRLHSNASPLVSSIHTLIGELNRLLPVFRIQTQKILAIVSTAHKLFRPSEEKRNALTPSSLLRSRLDVLHGNVVIVECMNNGREEIGDLG